MFVGKENANNIQSKEKIIKWRSYNALKDINYEEFGINSLDWGGDSEFINTKAISPLVNIWKNVQKLEPSLNLSGEIIKGFRRGSDLLKMPTGISIIST
jgi:hypothetical protein